ncbi:MAG TPA: response regulator [Nitrospirota bacterium]|nr:response regulator [Nitrospirota bacterium]
MAHSVADVDRKEFRCLVADDSAFARKNIAQVLEKLGGSVVGEASNGLEALALYGSLHPDLVLLDITMPQLDGVETLRQIIEQDKNARVIMVSSIGHKEMVWKAICLGAKSFVTKPYDPDYAGMIIQEVVGKNGGK